MSMDENTIVTDAIRRFSHLGNLTIARYILNTYGDYFENDLERIRSQVRYYRGRSGSKETKRKNKELFINSQITIPQTWRKTRTDYHLQPGLWLVLSDLHVPFHEIKPIESAVQYGQSQKVSGLFINGDLQDCAAVSYWPQQRRDFNKEIEAVIDMLDWLRKEFPKMPFVYKPGNHEYRLPRYYVSKAPELVDSPLAAMETILGFENRDIEFLDYYQKVMAGELPIIHGHEVLHLNRTVNPARGLFLRAKTFSACSHCHTTSQHTTRDINDMMLSTWSFACLCDIHPDYSPMGTDWNWGMALINVEKNGNFEVENRRILHNGKIV